MHWLSPGGRRKLLSLIEDQYIDHASPADLNGLRERLGLHRNAMCSPAGPTGDRCISLFPDWFAAPPVRLAGQQSAGRLFALCDEHGQHPLDDELQQFSGP